MWAAASPTMTRIARVQENGPPTALATEIARTIPTHMAIMRTAMLSIAPVLLWVSWPWPASCRCAISTIPCRRMITESSAPVPAPRTDRPSRADHPGQGDEPARCLWKERVNAYRPVTLGLTVAASKARGNLVLRRQFWFVRAALLLTEDRGSSEAPAKTLRLADFVGKPRWQSHRDASASSGGSREIPIRPAERGIRAEATSQ